MKELGLGFKALLLIKCSQKFSLSGGNYHLKENVSRRLKVVLYHDQYQFPQQVSLHLQSITSTREPISIYNLYVL